MTHRISPCSSLASSTASPPPGSPCSTLPAGAPGNMGTRDCAYGSITSPTSTLESRDSGIIATLTSYSENAEHGGKHSEGSRGSLKLWQAQKSMGADSFLYRVDENMAASTYSLNKIPERSLEHSVSHSAHSIPLYLMPRPNSVAVAGKHVLCCRKLMCAVRVLQCHYDIIIITGSPRGQRAECVSLDLPKKEGGKKELFIEIEERGGGTERRRKDAGMEELDILHHAINHTGLLRKILVQRGEVIVFWCEGHLHPPAAEGDPVTA
ncbi:protein TANC2-like [Sinocyclocheilus grahami]|uniref:protein TANC2-like n=1 Tax=Sinocyclocheilus grahami TaxID=75366 RepID=UPI0007AC6AF5|nr:PREDICTED: protein TANC2-like [Sinocyclocheilus grahami]